MIACSGVSAHHPIGVIQGLQRLPRDAEVLAFEAGGEEEYQREVDEVEWHGNRVCLHLGTRPSDPPQR
jgi:hypothetical protein